MQKDPLTVLQEQARKAKKGEQLALKELVTTVENAQITRLESEQQLRNHPADVQKTLELSNQIHKNLASGQALMLVQVAKSSPVELVKTLFEASEDQDVQAALAHDDYVLFRDAIDGQNDPLMALLWASANKDNRTALLRHCEHAGIEVSEQGTFQRQAQVGLNK